MIDSRNPETLQRSADYQAFVDSTPYIDGQDFNPIVIDNVFDASDIKHIYKVVNNTPIENLKVAGWGGQASWFYTHFNRIVENKIRDIAKEIFKDEVQLLEDYSFVRYSQEFGYNPKLFPHTDKRETPRMLFDVQIRADEEWAIVVEETKYYLNDNQALIFHGTNQTHWREQKQIGPHSRIDMLFANLQFTDKRGFQKNSYENSLGPRTRFLREKYNLTDTPEPVERKFYELQ